MRIERLPLDDAREQILLHNVMDEAGQRVLRKGVRLDADAVERLRTRGLDTVDVAILEAGDVWEEDAAASLTAALLSDGCEASWSVGGRANIFAAAAGVLHVDDERLLDLNTLPGITLATAPPFSVVQPHGKRRQIATLKIIPYAIPRARLDEAIALAATPTPLLHVRPLHAWSVALLLTGDVAVHATLRKQFEPPTRARIEALGSTLDATQCVAQDEASIADAARALLNHHELLIVGGQTSIMDRDDLVPRALRAAGVNMGVHGAPVDPGNLLALGYFVGVEAEVTSTKPILCAPGCARSTAHNVVDLVLPRLLTGEHLDRRDMAALGAGGLLR